MDFIVLLQNINLYDKVINVTKGVAYSTDARMSDIWAQILLASRPDFNSPARKPKSNADYWLFKQADNVDVARKIKFSREPSEFQLRYSEYQQLMYELKAAQISGTEAWRFHPQLASYASLPVNVALLRLADDWIKYGYKIEIDSALSKLDSEWNTSEWMDWMAAE